jgi:chorismate mutase-like protein
MTKEIDALREEIDVIDRELVNLLNRRARVAQQIGEIKRVHNLPIYEPNREQAVALNVEGANAGPLDSSALHQIYERIIDVMRRVQRTDQLNQRGTQS